MKLVTAYTDGSSKGNPGNGGIGVYLKYQDITKEISFGFNNVTNNQMELLAAAYSLFVVKERCKVMIYSDSEYVVNGFNNKWIDGWKRNGWKNRAGNPVKNQDLWKLLDRLVRKHDVSFKHVKGHSDIIGNVIADRLAVSGSNVIKRYDISKFIAEMERKI